MSESEVRMTDMRVRSALMRVRWKDMPVRREESSTDIRSGSDFEVTWYIFLPSGGGAGRFARRHPPYNATDRSAQEQIGDKGEEKGGDDRFPRIECLVDLQLIDRVHEDPKEEDACGGHQPLVQPSHALALLDH